MKEKRRQRESKTDGHMERWTESDKETNIVTVDKNKLSSKNKYLPT